MTAIALLAALSVCSVARGSDGHIARTRAATAKFRRANPCPATGRGTGACPGWTVDHVQPLCAGGADKPENMAWQTTKDAKAKDRAEDALCGWIRKICKGVQR